MKILTSLGASCLALFIAWFAGIDFITTTGSIVRGPDQGFALTLAIAAGILTGALQR
jgi:hypothetical protein